MVNVTVQGTVHAPPTKVFAYLSDLANWPSWMADMKSTTLVSGTRGKVGAAYHYVSKAMGQSFESTIRVTALEPGRLIAFEGDWVGMIRPMGRHTVEAAEQGTRVTLNPHPETRGMGKLMSPLMRVMIRRLQKQHLAALNKALRG